MKTTASAIGQEDAVKHQNNTLSDNQLLFDATFNRPVTALASHRDERVAINDVLVDSPAPSLQLVDVFNRLITALALHRDEHTAINDVLVDFPDPSSHYVDTLNVSSSPLPTTYWYVATKYGPSVFWSALSHRLRHLSQMGEVELLDWDATIKTPPTRRLTTVFAFVEYRGRAKPMPVVDPWD